ncbi:MAG: hypothetical protein MUF42_12040 [Cytophagaceae bacterium]|nr:hypothetical protein [Cytophagaceae bacterium]
MQSGAERIFVSTNDHLDSTIFSWKGGHDGLYFFQKEKVLMSLSFLGSAKIIQDTIELISINNFLQSNNYYALSKDNSFEKFGLNDIKGYYQHSLFYALCQSNLRMEVKNDLKPPHGEKYLQIQGNASCLENGYFVGGMQFWSNLSSFYLSDWEEKNDLYFNLYVYGRANGDRIALRLMEADPETDQLKDPQNQDPKVLDCANGPYFQNKHCPCVDDSWVYEYTIEHEGWKLISIPFSQFKVSTIENVGNHGNKKFEPNRIHKIEIGLIAPSKYGAVSTGIDFPTISRNGPFDPSQ